MQSIYTLKTAKLEISVKPRPLTADDTRQHRAGTAALILMAFLFIGEIKYSHIFLVVKFRLIKLRYFKYDLFRRNDRIHVYIFE